jgi:TRAP-type C4-dicarboxylate transport system substrate-binding protein
MVLVLASSNEGGQTGIGRQLDAVPGIDQFVKRVAEVSRGRMTVRVDEGGRDDVAVIREVAAGRVDLGWAATAAFDVVGVRAFQPLHAPFLINSYAAEAAVVNDPLAGRMLAEVTPLGLTGLALVADELQMPAAAKPLLTPEDFHGLGFGLHDSQIQSKGLAALGARAAAPNTAGSSGRDVTWWRYIEDDQVASLPYVTANAILWPRTLAIFGNTERLIELDEQAQEWLRQASKAAASWSAGHAADRTPFEIEQACAAGVRITTANPSQLAALRAAAEPVYGELRADPALKGTLTRIESLVRSVEQTARQPQPCSKRSAAGGADDAPPLRYLTAAGRAGALPPGTYRYSVSEEELRANGFNDFAARATAGVWTWTLGRGHWKYAFKPSSRNVPTGYAFDTCEGWYDVEADTIAFATYTPHAQLPTQCAPDYWSARWSPTSNGLRMTMYLVDEPHPDYLFGGKIWQRID